MSNISFSCPSSPLLPTVAANSLKEGLQGVIFSFAKGMEKKNQISFQDNFSQGAKDSSLP